MLKLQSEPIQRVLNHCLATRYMRQSWVDNRANQKVFVGPQTKVPTLYRQFFVYITRTRDIC